MQFVSKLYSSHPYSKRSYLLIALLPLFLCWMLILNQSREWAITLTEKNAVNLSNQNCMLIEQSMESLNQSLNALQNSSSFNELIISSYQENPPSRYTLSKEAEVILSQYFLNFDSIASLYIISPNYSDSFYNSTALPDILRPEQITHYKTLSENPGAILWFPTAPHSDVIQLGERYSKYYSNYDIISLGVQMKLNYYKYRYLHEYENSKMPPAILLFIYPSIFSKNITLDENTFYYIYTENDHPIYTSGQKDYIEGLPVPHYSDLDSQGHFRSFYNNGAKGTFIYSQVLETTGWIITSYTSIDNTLHYLGTNISIISLLVICFTILLVLVVHHFTIRTISEPLTLLAAGLAQTAAGHYEHRICNTKYKDYEPTFQEYNNMNQNISKLIKENYETKISEKELEIQLIQLQFNPHFLYNMLNICSLMALEADQAEISNMLSKISYMMRYAVKTTTPFVRFQEELRYVEAYISAMQLRTNNLFTYESDLDPNILNALVPKFLLQPFVENAILHGFGQKQSSFSYHLHITAHRQEEDIIFIVKDNGSGIVNAIHDSLWKKNSSGIGIANTHSRIQLYYGEAYGVQIDTVPTQGTIVTVKIPYQEP